MIQKFKEHIEKEFPFLKESKLLLAISGGIDSVVLFDLLQKLQYNISLAHCNFKLREKESDLDEEFVKNLAHISSNQIFTISFDTKSFAKKNKLSTQLAARELRYTWFQDLINQHDFDFLVTAHHADDNLETFLINLTRGSGLDGFTGIPKQNGNIIRPLLPFSREEIENYAQKNQLKWREDTSNASTKYLRNKVRHKVVPILKEINPSLLVSFEKTIENLQESKNIIQDRIEEISKNIISKDFSTSLEKTRLNIKEIQKLSNPKAYLYYLLKDFHFTEWNDVYDLLNAQSGKQIFSKTHRLVKDRDFLLLSKNINLNSDESYSILKNQPELKQPIHLNFEEVLEKSIVNKQSIYVDKELLNYPLKVRKWKKGDYIYPVKMQGKKKVSKYFKDEKFSAFDKENTWLLCDATDQIIWIINHRQDRRFLGKNNLKISANT